MKEKKRMRDERRGEKNDKRVRTTRKEEDMQTFRLAGGEKLRKEIENTGSVEEGTDRLERKRGR